MKEVGRDFRGGKTKEDEKRGSMPMLLFPVHVFFYFAIMLMESSHGNLVTETLYWFNLVVVTIRLYNLMVFGICGFTCLLYLAVR